MSMKCKLIQNDDNCSNFLPKHLKLEPDQEKAYTIWVSCPVQVVFTLRNDHLS